MMKILETILRLLGIWRDPTTSRDKDLHRAHQLALPEAPEAPEPVRVPAALAIKVEMPPPPPPAESPLPMLVIDDKGWPRGDGVTIVPSLRTQGLATARLTRIKAGAVEMEQPPEPPHVEGITWHWTDTRGVGAVRLAQRIVALPPPKMSAGSCHAWLGADGAIAASVPCGRGSWHAGYGHHFARDATGRWSVDDRQAYSANAWAFGVEIENVGEVRRAKDPRGRDVWAGWPFSFGTKYGAPTVVPDDEVYVHPRNAARGWHRFAHAQELAAERLVRALRGRYALLRENCAWGHVQIDPDRRTDPGPLWLGSVNGDGYTVPKVGTCPDGILHRILDRVFGEEKA